MRVTQPSESCLEGSYPLSPAFSSWVWHQHQPGSCSGSKLSGASSQVLDGYPKKSKSPAFLLELEQPGIKPIISVISASQKKVKTGEKHSLCCNGPTEGSLTTCSANLLKDNLPGFPRHVHGCTWKPANHTMPHPVSVRNHEYLYFL